MFVGVNGKIVPVEQAHVSVLDHGFLYGAGLFETMRTVGGRPMLWEEHMARLRASAVEIGIEVPWNDAELLQHIVDTVQANGLLEAYVRLTVTRGEGALGPSSASCAAPTLVIYVKELQLPAASVYEQGRDLIIFRTVRNTPETPVRVKSLNYMNSLLAYRELEQRKASEGIQLTSDGYVAEGAVSNLFFVVDGELLTPSLAAGILPGITRAWVIERVMELGPVVREGTFKLEEIMEASEAFTTSSVVGIVPAVSLDGAIRFGDGSVGVVTRRLMEMWEDAVFAG